MEREKYKAGMGLLAAAFGDPGVDRWKAYWIAFGDDDGDAFVSACGRCMSEFRPTNAAPYPYPAAIRDRFPGHVNLGTEAETAWAHVLNSATDGPAGYSPADGTKPTGADLTEQELDSIGGARGLKRLLAISNDPEQIGFARRDFIERYKAYTTSNQAGLPPGRVPGVLSKHEQKQIGDK